MGQYLRAVLTGGTWWLAMEIRPLSDGGGGAGGGAVLTGGTWWLAMERARAGAEVPGGWDSTAGQYLVEALGG